MRLKIFDLEPTSKDGKKRSLCKVIPVGVESKVASIHLRIFYDARESHSSIERPGNHLRRWELHLTEVCLQIHKAHFHALWRLRRMCLLEMSSKEVEVNDWKLKS